MTSESLAGPVDVTVIVLGWNGRHYLDDCLGSLRQQRLEGLTLELLYVDNGSRDGSVDHLRERFPEARVIALDRNYGYAEGNNIGAREAKGRVIVFLNQDTVVHRDCARELVRALDGDASLGACHANIIQPWYAEFGEMELERPPSTLHTADLSKLAYVRYRTLAYRDAPVGTLFLHGVCIAIRRDVVDRLDYVFDPDFFAYAEDMDLALRVRALGLRTAVISRAVVYHEHVLKTALSTRILWHTVRIIRNRALALYKVSSGAEFAVLLPLVILGAPFNASEFGLGAGRRALYFVALVPVAIVAAATLAWHLPRYRTKRARVLAQRAPRVEGMLRRLLRQPW